MTEKITYSDFFPYPSTREGQEEMMSKIEVAVREGTNMCCEAPNGFGKTSVTLSGVLPWIQENDAKVLYCARTHRQLDRVVEELAIMDEGRSVTGVSFRGRRHMCLNPFVLENADFVAPISEVCGQLKAARRCAYYERLRSSSPESLLDTMPSGILSAPDMIKIGKSRKMCPYELAKKLAKTVDIIALSYLYVFNPFILATFMPELETPLSKMVLVQDEAHNVPSTALDSASDSLTLGTVRAAMREATNYNDSVSKDFCRGLAKAILDISTGLNENDERYVNPEGVYSAALNEAGLTSESQPLSHMKDLGTKIRKGLLKAGKYPRSSIFRIADFMLHWMKLCERDDYAFILSSSRKAKESRKISLDLVALDPTSVTSPILSMVHNSIAISGTISPLDAYSDMLGFGSESVKATFQNPFATKNRMGIIVQGLDTSYKNRSKGVFARMTEHCVAVAHATPGNTGIFTASYFVAQALIKAGLEKKLKKRLYLERQGMKTVENDKLIENFKNRGELGGAVLLGVQGGRNSEGGDFPGNTMDSVVVVGVPYARPTPRMEALIAYFNQRFDGRGRDYAYVLPAMTRAIQAAGRPVRRLDDKGAIIFLDQRFATPYLRRFMPSWLDDVTRELSDSPDLIAHEVSTFFSH